VRRRGGHGESIRIGAVQQVPNAPCFVLLVAHHEHDDLLAAGLTLAPADGLAAIRGPASLGLIAPLLVERDNVQATLAEAPLAVTAATRQDPPFHPMVLPASNHARALWAGTWKMEAERPPHNRP
jgi:hypothetical protein